MMQLQLLTVIQLLLLSSYCVTSFTIQSGNVVSSSPSGKVWGIGLGHGQRQTGLEVRATTTLFAKKQKKKRRRKSDKQAPSPTPSFDNTISDDISEENELPDFDLVEDIDLIEQQQRENAAAVAAASTPALSSGVPPAVSAKPFDVEDPAVKAAMRATKGTGGGSVSTQDLIRSRNRELEAKLVVNVIKEDVPSFGEYAKKSSTVTKNGPGKKAAKREARVTAAREAETADEEEEGIFSKLPFFNKNDEEKEKKTAVKLLEEGTWACIYALMAWEVYINSPLFSRAAPLTPAVF